MTTSTRVLDGVDAIAADEAASAGGGFFHRAFQRLMAAREARARAVAYQHLARLSDERLVDLGFELNEIRRVRSHADDPVAYWA